MFRCITPPPLPPRNPGLIDIRSARDARCAPSLFLSFRPHMTLKYACRCANLQFWLQIGIIMVPLLIFDKIIYSFATCSCCISVNRSVRSCCEKLGGCFFYFIIFLGIASTSFGVSASLLRTTASQFLAGIAFVVSSPRQTSYSCASVPDGCRDSMVSGFALGRVLGYVTWCVTPHVHLSSCSLTVKQVLGSNTRLLVELQA